MPAHKDDSAPPAAGRLSIVFLPWNQVQVEPGFNARDFSSAVNQRHVETLKASIAAQGVEVPLTCREGRDRKFYIIDGESRWRAVQQLMRDGIARSKSGKDLTLLPVFVDNSIDETERVARLIVHNTSCPLAEYEKATVIKRLLDAKWTQQRVARYIGFSQSYVSRLAFLASMPEDIFGAVRDGKLSGKAVTSLQSNPNAQTILRKRLEAQTSGVRAALAESSRTPAEERLGGALREVYDICLERTRRGLENPPRIERIVRRSLARDGFELPRGAASSFGTFVRFGDQAEFQWRLGMEQASDEPIVWRAVEALDKIRIESKGRLEITAYPNGVLGSQPAMLSLMREGVLEIVTHFGTTLEAMCPAAAMPGIGYAFEDPASAYAAFDGELGGLVRRELMARGLFALERVWDVGFSHLNTSAKPIHDPKDLSGTRIRVSPSRQHAYVVRALGGCPVPLAPRELEAAFDDKVVEGLDTSLDVVAPRGWAPLIKYVSLSAHHWNCYWTLLHPAKWHGLPKSLQEIVARNFAEATLAARRDIAEIERSTVEELRRRGIAFVTPDRERFRARLRSSGYYDLCKDEFGPAAWSVLAKYADVA